MKDKMIKLEKMPAEKYNCTVDSSKYDEKTTREIIRDFIGLILSKNMIISEENESGEMTYIFKTYIFKEVGSALKGMSKHLDYDNDLVEMIDNLKSEPEFCLFSTYLGSFIQKIEINYRNFDSEANKVKIKYDSKKKFGRIIFDFYEPSIGSDEHITIQRRKAEIIFHTAYDLHLILDEFSK